MSVGFITIIAIVLVFLVIRSIISFSLKLIGLGIIAVAICFTLWICTSQPDMHKPFSMNTIEYLFKINKDGSVTRTKQITNTLYTQEEVR